MGQWACTTLRGFCLVSYHYYTVLSAPFFFCFGYLSSIYTSTHFVALIISPYSINHPLPTLAPPPSFTPTAAGKNG